MRALIPLGLVLGLVVVGRGQEPAGARPELVEQPHMGSALHKFGLEVERKPPGYPLEEWEVPKAYGLRLPLVRQTSKEFLMTLKNKTHTWLPYVRVEEDIEGEIELMEPRLDDIIEAAFSLANPVCQYWLGVFYRKGMKKEGLQLLDPNPIEAAELFRASESWGCARASMALGDMHAEHGGVENAIRHYMKAMQNGEKAGCGPLGDLLLGEGEYKAAFKVWSWGANCGDATSMSALATLMSRADVTEENMDFLETAAELFKKAAELGDAAALCELGQMHERGLMGPINMTIVASYYACAADAGDRVGMKNFARLLREGDGVERNLTAADEWDDEADYVDEEEEELAAMTEARRTHEAIEDAEDSLLIAGRPSRYHHHAVPFRPQSDEEIKEEEDIGWDGHHELLGHKCKWKYLDNDYYSKLDSVHYDEDFVSSIFTDEEIEKHEEIGRKAEADVDQKVQEHMALRLRTALKAEREWERMGMSSRPEEEQEKFWETVKEALDDAASAQGEYDLPAVCDEAEEQGTFSWRDPDNWKLFVRVYLPHLVSGASVKKLSKWPKLAEKNSTKGEAAAA